jgi:hypothetical protein
VVMLFAAALLAVRNGRGARAVALTSMALPVVAFASGLVAVHQVSTAVLVVLVLAAAAVLGASCAAGRRSLGGHPATGVVLVAVVTWVVLAADVMTGGRLQLDTPFGSTPTTGGRFQGFGNLAFGLFGAVAMVMLVAPVVIGWLDRPGVDDDGHVRRSPWTMMWTVSVAIVSVVLVGAPTFGSDLGGTLAIVPAALVGIAAVLRIRISLGRLVLAIAAGVAVVVLAALLDRSRPPDQQTHLGRFAQRVLDGDATDIVRRKLAGNWAILTSSPWTVLFGVALIGLMVWIVVRRERVVTWSRSRPPLDLLVGGWIVLAVLGAAVNDSGIAVPAMMVAVVVPVVIAVVVPISSRAERAEAER